MPDNNQCNVDVFDLLEPRNSLLQYASTSSHSSSTLGPNSTNDAGVWKHMFLINSFVRSPRPFHLFNAYDVQHAVHFMHLAILVITCGIFGSLFVYCVRRDSITLDRNGRSRSRRTSKMHISDSVTVAQTVSDSWNIGTAMKKPSTLTSVAYGPLARSFKLAFKVGLSSCLVAAIGGTLVPMGSFHMSSSGITVVIVMEMASLDRLLVKGFLRIMGTFIGAVQALVAIRLIEWSKHMAFAVYASLFLLIVPNAMLQILNLKNGYMYLASNISFIFIFYGYWFEGADAISSRITAVVVAVCVAWLVDMIWPLVWLDPIWFSGDNVVEASGKLLQKIFASIDYTFVHDEILAKDVSANALAAETWQDRFFQADTVHFFNMRQKHLLFRDLQARLKRTSPAKRVAIERDLARLYSEASNAWQDVEFTYAVICRNPPSKYNVCFEGLHAVYAQACSLSHVSFTNLSDGGQAIWRDSPHIIEELREAFYNLEEPLVALLRQCHKHGAGIHDCVEEVAESMEAVALACELAQRTIQSLHKQDRMRLDIFFMTISLIVSELGMYTIKLMECFAEASDENLVERLGCLSRSARNSPRLAPNMDDPNVLNEN